MAVLILAAMAANFLAALAALANMMPGGGGPPPPPPGSSGSGAWRGGIWRDVDGRMYIEGRWFEPEPVGSNVMHRMTGRILRELSIAQLFIAPLLIPPILTLDCTAM